MQICWGFSFATGRVRLCYRMPQRRLVVLQSEIDVEPLGAVVLSRMSEGQRTTLDAQGRCLLCLGGPRSTPCHIGVLSPLFGGPRAALWFIGAALLAWRSVT
jgi:hypothetical protein